MNQSREADLGVLESLCAARPEIPVSMDRKSLSRGRLLDGAALDIISQIATEVGDGQVLNQRPVHISVGHLRLLTINAS